MNDAKAELGQKILKLKKQKGLKWADIAGRTSRGDWWVARGAEAGFSTTLWAVWNPAGDWRDAVVADGAERFADAVLGLLDDPQRRIEIGRAGRAYVEAHHQWDRIAARLETLYGDVLVVRRGDRLERVAG